MTAIFTTTFRTALLADETLMDSAEVEMVLFPTAAALVAEDEGQGLVPTTGSIYAGTDTIAELEEQLGWGPSLSETVTVTMFGNAIEDETSATFFSIMDDDGFVLPNDFPTSLVKAVAFVYKGPTSTPSIGYFNFPGTVGNYLSVPTFNITNDITVVARIRPTDWTPATAAVIASKWRTGALSWAFRLGTTGALQFFRSPDGTAAVGTMTSTANLSAAPIDWLWVAVTYRASDGGAKFWTAPDGSAWTQLGTTLSGTANILFDSTSPIDIGALDGGLQQPFNGNIQHVSIRDGVGTTPSLAVGGTEIFRFDGAADLDGVASDATSLTATTGQTITVHRAGSPSTRAVFTANPLDRIMFITDTPVVDGVVMHAGDGIIAQADPAKGRILLSWASDSVIEGPLVRLVGPAPFEPARTQHLWIYPQRTNMIANPSFEEDVDYWRSDGAITQISTKTACTVRVGTKENLTALTGLPKVDTIQLVAADRVLVKNQELPQNNGVYVAAVGAWTRATDANTAEELEALPVYIKGGTQRGEVWTCQPASDVVLGTTPLPFNLTPSMGGGNFAGHLAGKVAESNMFPLITRYNETGWTLQMRVRSDGEVKVGLIGWVADFDETITNWGHPDEIWLPNGGWLTACTCRNMGEATTGMLRVETQGTYIDLDMVCVEPGTMPANYEDWPYFDGDSLYGIDGDYSWYERPHKSYSCWYNDREAVFGRLFAWNVSSQDALPGGVFTDTEAQTQGLAHQWVPAGTPLLYHTDVLYPEDPKNALPPVTGDVLNRRVGGDSLGVANPWIAREAYAGTPGVWGPLAWADPAPSPPESVSELQRRSVRPYPITLWTTGQYVQTLTAGVTGRAWWTGDRWEPGTVEAPFAP